MKTILWDFDGVLLDSMDVRDFGFKEIFKTFDESDVAQLIAYHRINGGLSRYVKIRYFYEHILRRPISESQISNYANQFSLVMKEELINPENLLLDAVSFVKENSKTYNFHIVSGSDQNELRFLCKELGIDSCFLSIHGSPTPKKQLVKTLLAQHDYPKNSTCLIGDSINDYEAAEENNIKFFGYNNEELKRLSEKYITSFSEFDFF